MHCNTDPGKTRQRGAVYFLPVSLLRSFIYIGLTTWCGVSLWQRIVQAQVRRYLAATAALCVFWLSIRTVKFFFAATPAAIRYLWYKNKKRIDNDRENWVVFKDVHEPIIDRAVWEQIQQKRGKVRKRRTNEGEKNMFSGLLVCADCGNNLHFHFNQGNPEIRYFNCSNYKGNRGTCTSTHYVRVDFLEQVVLGEIKRLTKFASRYEDDFVKAVMGSTQQNVALDRRLKEKELAALQVRDEELDGLFERIYEDNVSGKLSDDRFAKMSRRYEDEQKEISEKIKALRAEMDKLSSKSVTADMFISTVRKYTRAKVLTPRMLNELIDHIEVHQAEKIDGIWEQHLVIHYNCVGAIFIPDVFPLPAPQVSVNTRRRSCQLRPRSTRCMKKSECSYSLSNAVRTLDMVREAGLEPARP